MVKLLSMKAEIVAIGTELLLGQIVDTNAAYLAQELAGIGVDLFYKTTVGDNTERIAGVIRQACERSDVVITSGGLGPTVDDMTRAAVAQATGRGLQFSPDAWDEIQALFRRWGRAPDENNRRQALLPAGSRMISNPVGTAPAFILETGALETGALQTRASTIISLPGVPREMKVLMEGAVLPYLRQRLAAEPAIIRSRVLRTCGIGESNVDTLIGDLETLTNPTVGLLAHPGQTDIRITAKAPNGTAADALITPIEAEIRQRLGAFIFGVGSESLEEVVACLLLQQAQSLALIESNTGGALADRLRATPCAACIQAAAAVNDLTALSALLPELPADGVWPSAELTLHAAQAWRRRSGAAVALVIIGTMQPQETMYSGERGESFLALVRTGREITRQLPMGGVGEVTGRWIGNRALDLLRRDLLGLLADHAV